MTIVDHHTDRNLFPPRLVVTIELYTAEHEAWLTTKRYPYPRDPYLAVRRRGGVLEYAYAEVCGATPDECADKAATLAYLLDADLDYAGPNPAPEHLDKAYDIGFDAAADRYEQASQR